MNIIIVCVLSAIQVFSSLSSPEREREEGGGELTDFCNNFF